MKLLNIRKITVVLTISLLVFVRAEAQTCSNPNVVVGPGQTCSTQINITSSPATVSVSNGGVINVNNTNAIGIYNTGTISTFSNNGAITATATANNSGYGISNSGTITNLTNIGTISGYDNSRGAGFGINLSSGLIGTLNNSGTINGGTLGGATGNYGIQFNGTINTLNNSGTISGGTDGVIGSGNIGAITNSGSILADINALYLYPGATIYSLTNSSAGVISSGANSIYSEGTITAINNSGTIGNGTTASANGIYNNGGVITTLNNFGGGSIGGTTNGLINNGTINTLSNSGTISGGVALNNQGTITTLTNNINGTIGGTLAGIQNSVITSASDPSPPVTNYDAFGNYSITQVDTAQTALVNGGSIAHLTNSGTINGGINNTSATITTLINTGTINGGIDNRATSNTITTTTTVQNYDSFDNPLPSPDPSVSVTTVTTPGTITTLTNLGVINGGINNTGGIITALNNAQGGNTPLALTGNLPVNYNIIINSTSNFGRLSVTTPGSSTTAFGIYAGSVVSSKIYTAVISGVGASNLTTYNGTYNGQAWSLSQEGSSGIWDLLFPNYYTGPSTVNTQQSLANTVQPLQGTMTVLNTALANSFSYDCTEFGANNICVSAGGRNTAVSAANGLNNTSALLIAAYRPHPNYRIGAYADQNLSVNNAGSTVNLGNNTPLVGLFGAWNQRLGGTGAEVKVSAAYGQKNATVTRSVVGTGATASEAGNGSAPINSQGAQVTAKYGFGIVENVIVSPYVGVRYTQNNMNGYTEGASGTVTAPLTYSALNTNATTALAGLGASYRFIPQATAFASAGVESDTNTNNGTYSATGVAGLTPINFNANPVKTRPTATVGAYYDIEKNQRLGITGIYRQEPYQAVQTTTVMATYTVGL